MKITFLLVSLMFAILTGESASAYEAVGVRKFSVVSPERNKNLAVTIWYPAQKGLEKILVGDSKLFKGVPAFTNAPLAPGRHPLILFSHGSGGRVENLGWLANSLAEAGFIVAGPNHPGTTSGDSTPIDTTKLWKRTQDLSNVLTALSSDREWGEVIDSEKIGVLGFSLGGAAAMQIAGAKAKLDDYARYCDMHRTMADCVWFAGGRGYVNGEAVVSEKVDLRSIDKERFERSNLDPRISAAVLVDPALAQAYDAQSLKKIAIPMHFINLGRPEKIPVAVIAEDLAKLTPKGHYTQIDDAVHFSFLGECQDGGAEFLKSLGEKELLCADGGNRSRADIHAQLREIIVRAFTRELNDGR